MNHAGRTSFDASGTKCSQVHGRCAWGGDEAFAVSRGPLSAWKKRGIAITGCRVGSSSFRQPLRSNTLTEAASALQDRSD